MTRLLPVTSVMTTAAAFAALCTGAGVANADGFSQTNLVSDMPGLATATDSSLVNPWGVSFANGSPIWISDQGTQTSPLFPVTGSTGVASKPLFTVNIPACGSLRSDRAGCQRGRVGGLEQRGLRHFEHERGEWQAR